MRIRVTRESLSNYGKEYQTTYINIDERGMFWYYIKEKYYDTSAEEHFDFLSELEVEVVK